MNELLLIFQLFHLFNFKQLIFNKSIIHKNHFNKNGVYFIKSLFNNYYFSDKKNKFILSNRLTQIKIIENKPYTYLILFINYNRNLGIDDKNRIILYNQNNIINIKKIVWELIKIDENIYLIKNIFNQKYIMIDKNTIKFINIDDIYSINKKQKFLFQIFKLFEVNGIIKEKHLKIIEDEPIDVLIKYIDLRDKTLKRKGIKQIYKDFDNEELRYSLRSILENIPWIRKIFILMPNKKVKFLKSSHEIKEKIVYINDKDLLGYDSANIFAFTFNLFKMEKFNISKNFIYMEDDFFIGKPLNKSDFFYYDEKEKKVLPYILTSNFEEINKKKTLEQYYTFFKIKNSFHPHSGRGWKFSILSTNKYFIERYNFTIISTLYTHTAFGENINDLKEIFREIQDYKYINETLYSKERNILTLNQPHFLNLYQLNIKHKKVHSIPYKYINMENINFSYLNRPLFVINTCGNNKPSKNEYKVQKYIMEKRFPYPTKYEYINHLKTIKFFFVYYLFLIIAIIKMYIKFRNKKKV